MAGGLFLGSSLLGLFAALMLGESRRPRTRPPRHAGADSDGSGPTVAGTRPGGPEEDSDRDATTDDDAGGAESGNGGGGDGGGD